MYAFDEIKKADSEIADAIQAEMERQNSHLELIASENWVSKAVMAAMGSPLTNKYAEGYPGKRYYGGCQCVDVVEDLARERAKKLFGCDYANVQPHSGAQANLAVFFAMLEPGDKVMGMNLDHGGHLTHGSPANISGKYFNVVSYGVNDEGVIDYDKVREIAVKEKPKMIIAGASAYARIIDFKKFREIADEVGAYLMVDMAHIAGLVAAGLHPSPIPYADVTTTTTHKTLRGPRGGLILCNQEAADKFNFNKAVFPGIQGGPLEHVIAGKAVCFKEALEQPLPAPGRGERARPALADDLGGDALGDLAQGVDLRVQAEVAVAVGVAVDEPGGQGQSPRVEDLARLLLRVQDDAPRPDAHIPHIGGAPRSIDDARAADAFIQHANPSSWRRASPSAAQAPRGSPPRRRRRTCAQTRRNRPRRRRRAPGRRAPPPGRAGRTARRPCPCRARRSGCRTPPAAGRSAGREFRPAAPWRAGAAHRTRRASAPRPPACPGGSCSRRGLPGER